jgi:hypothetical protein
MSIPSGSKSQIAQTGVDSVKREMVAQGWVYKSRDGGTTRLEFAKTGRVIRVQVRTCSEANYDGKAAFWVARVSYNTLATDLNGQVTLDHVCVLIENSGKKQHFVVPARDVRRIAEKRYRAYYRNKVNPNPNTGERISLALGPELTPFLNRWDLL